MHSASLGKCDVSSQLGSYSSITVYVRLRAFYVRLRAFISRSAKPIRKFSKHVFSRDNPPSRQKHVNSEFLLNNYILVAFSRDLHRLVWIFAVHLEGNQVL